MIEQLQTSYELIFGRKAPARYKNDQKWLTKKIEEQTPLIAKEMIPAQANCVKKGSTVEVYGKNEQLVRVYSKEVHGSDFEKLAKKFTEKLNK